MRVKRWSFVLFAAFVLLLTFRTGSTFAYTGGLLDAMGYTSKDADTTSSNGLKTAMTDNSQSTYLSLRARSGYVEWTLPKVANITSYIASSVNFAGVNVHVQFKDQSGTVLYDAALGAETLVSVNVKNVYYVRLNSTGVNGIAIREFNVFGTYAMPTPTSLVAYPDTKAIDLSWKDVPVAGFSNYNIYQDGVLVGTSLTNSFRVTNLNPDEVHSYAVSSYYSAGDVTTDKSNIVNAAAYDDPLNAPTLNGLVSDTWIKLSWSGDSRSQSYELYMGDGTLLTNMGNSLTVSNLTVYTDYNYYVVAVDKYGRTVKSKVYTFSTGPPPEPVLPNITLVSSSYDRIRFTWSADSAGRIPYTVIFNGDNYMYTSNIALFDGLESDTSYTFSVSYIDDYGRTVSNSASFKTKVIPPPVAPKLTFYSLTSSSVRLAWNDVGETYELYQDGKLLIGDFTSVFYQLNNLTPETNYSFKVVAFDSFGRRNESQVVTLSTPKYSPPPVIGGGGSGGGGSGTDPPPVNDSGNPELDKPSDTLVQGSSDMKANALYLILVIIGVLIFVFGARWLIRLFKRGMNKSSPGSTSSKSSAGVRRGKGSSVRSASAVVNKPSIASSHSGNSFYKNNSQRFHKNSNKANGPRRNNYYVEKAYERRQGNHGRRKKR